MGYKLNKTDGTLLVDLVDGQLDTTTTSIGLIGKNYTGFGETLNENLIKMLENFANTSAPSVPLKGQLWYDTASARIKVYDGTSFKESGGPIVSQSEPANMVSGDLWLNSLTNQLYFYDGTDLTLAGPVYTAQQGKSGFETVTALDTQNNSKTTIRFFIGGNLIGVFANEEFTPAVGYTVPGITGNIKKGFNLIDGANFQYRGTSDSALSLTDSQGNRRTPAQLLPADSNGTTIGTLTVSNSGGLTIGTAQNNIQKIVGTSYVTENQLSNHDWKVRVRKTTGYVDAVVVDTDVSHVGIFKSQPLYTLHVGGDAKIDGQLIVQGTTTSIDTQNLRIEDKNIELAIQSDSTTGNNAAVDGGGIILKSSDLDKEFLWRNNTASWTSSENIDLAPTKGYKVNGNEVLNETALGSQVSSALGLTQIGTLTTLSVDNITLNDYAISTSGGGLQITSDGAITITNNQKISGMANPTSNQDAATKFYVDDSLDDEPVIVPLDITGLTNANIATIIEDIYPAANKKTGSYAYVPTSTLTGATVSGININSVANKSFIAVDANGVQNESVLQDIAFNNASGTVSSSVARGLKRYKVQAGTWVFDTDLGSSGGLW
tara:strand:+ start:1190 stop:3001 length:1812 start_codon:yes stop_codon:yes gene_type:complete